MKKIIIILFIVLFSFNAQASRLDKIIDLFAQILDSYPVKQTLIRIDDFSDMMEDTISLLIKTKN